MIISTVIPVMGSLAFIFRIWLCEKKLPEILLERRGFLSRMVNYYYFIALTICFSSDILNLSIISALPVLIIGFFINDIPAYRNFNRLYKLEQKKCWILLEGLTLHPPMLVTAIIFCIIGLKNVFQSLDLISAIASLILGVVPLMIFDKRWKMRKPVAWWMLIGGIGTWTGVLVYVYLL